MSIYTTLWEIKLPRRHPFDEEWVSVFAQAVPPHIGHPSCYPEGDPYADFLPPVVQEDSPGEDNTTTVNRAVAIVQEGRDRKEGQRYVDPLLVLTGEEFACVPFPELLVRIERAMGWDETVWGMFLLPDGGKRILRTKK